MKDRMYTWMPEWKEDEVATGGYFYRAFDLVEFIEKVEKTTKKKVVGIRFTPDSDKEDKLSKNIELVVR